MPTTIKHTSRQRITTSHGVELERAYIFMPSEHWAQLQRLCIANHQSGSQVIQQLISLASIGHQTKDTTHAKANTRND